MLINQGWPKSEHEDAILTSMLIFLQETKSMIRIKHAAAQSEGKKTKKGAMGDKPEEHKSLENVVIFIGENFPEYQNAFFI